MLYPEITVKFQFTGTVLLLYVQITEENLAKKVTKKAPVLDYASFYVFQSKNNRMKQRF
jgi:hypothetical protein